MTGAQVAKVRRAMGLKPDELADALGVHRATVYRWERTRGHVAAEPLQLGVLSKARGLDADRAAKVGRQVAYGLAVGGTLRAMLELLKGVITSR